MGDVIHLPDCAGRYAIQGILDVGPGIIANDGAETKPVRDEIHDVPLPRRDLISTYQHVYRIVIEKPIGQDVDDPVSESSVMDEGAIARADLLTQFNIVDILGPTEYLVQWIGKCRSSQPRYIFPGLSDQHVGIHDLYPDSYFHLYHTDLYKDVSYVAAYLYTAEAKEVVLITRFEPQLTGVLIPHTDVIKARFDKWSLRDIWKLSHQDDIDQEREIV